LEELFEGRLSHRLQVVHHVSDDDFHCLKAFSYKVILSLGNREKPGGARSGEEGGCGRVGLECFTKNSLTMLCEQAHYRDGGASFPQSTFRVAFFIPHPTDISELPDKNLDQLPNLQERICNDNALMIEKDKQHYFHA
jgi:hypothetical protein